MSCRRQVLVRLARIAAVRPPRALPTNKAVLAIENHPLHLAFRDVVVDADRAVGAEHVQFRPLAQSVVHRLGHGMLGQQLLFPLEKLLAQFGQHRHRLLLAQLRAAPSTESIPGLPFHRIERAHQLDRFPRDLGSGLLRIDHLSLQRAPSIRRA